MLTSEEQIPKRRISRTNRMYSFSSPTATLPTAEHGSKQDPFALRAGFWGLSAFYVVYCARPQEVIPGLGWIPVAKLTGALALLGLVLSLGRSPRKLSDLPREAFYLVGLISVLFLSAVLSPVWKGGAFLATLEFSKICILWVLAFLLITDLDRLRRIIYIQAASVSLVSLIALVKGYSVDRLNGVIGGIYSNPNDLAFAIVLSLPLALALLLMAKTFWVKAFWIAGVTIMTVALIRTASRAGLIDLIVAGTVCLWHFGIKGKRFYLIPAAACIGIMILAISGGTLRDRLGLGNEDTISQQEGQAAASYEERKVLMEKAVSAIAEYPVLGLGAGNFVVYSGLWLEVHAAYLQITVEGGIPALILYLLFFRAGFANLKRVAQLRLLGDAELFRAALLASLIGFVVGAAFSPEAYHFFPYLTVCCSSVLAAILAPARTSLAFKERPRYWRLGHQERVATPPQVSLTAEQN
jgi:O-antigen ligase